MRAAGLPPDPWQAELLADTSKRTLLLASRQSGKSQTVAAKILHEAATRPDSFILITAPTLRQAGEMFREKILPLWLACGQPLKTQNPTQLELRLSNGSRILSLPACEATIRGFSGVTHLVIDEAARVSDLLYRAVRPMLAVRGGSLTALSTPFGERGWFHDAWFGRQPWHKVKVTALQCPRLSPEFLEEERQAHGQVWFDQEYMAKFGALVGAIWPAERFPDSIWFDEYPTSRNYRLVRRVLAIDTSRGETELSDWQAFVLVSHYEDGSMWVDAELVRLDDLALFHKAEELIARWQPHATVVETAFAGYVLWGQLGRAGRSPYGRKRPGSQKKFDRIANRLGPLWADGAIHVRRTPGGRELVDQAKQFPIKDSHDDAVDALETGVELCRHLILPKGHPGRVPYEIWRG